MKSSASTAAAVAALLLTTASVDAGAQSSIIVSAQSRPPTLAVWSERVFRDIDKRLRVREGIATNRIPSGITSVKFNCSETGAPAGIALYKSSGFRELDRATMSAVRQVASLHPLPAGLKGDQVYIVNVLFANSSDDAGRQIARMRRQADKRNAWYNPQATHSAAIELAPSAG